MKVVDNKDACTLGRDDGQIRIAVAFGDGQVGTSIVLVEGAVIAAGADLQQVLLGDVSALAGKTAVVRSVVSQTNPVSDHFSVVHNITGKRMRERYIVSDVFDEDDVSVLIAETITFALER